MCNDSMQYGWKEKNDTERSRVAIVRGLGCLRGAIRAASIFGRHLLHQGKRWKTSTEELFEKVWYLQPSDAETSSAQQQQEL
jgi:hypothetical protein